MYESVKPENVPTSAGSMVPSEVHKYALEAAEKMVQRGDTSLVKVSYLDGKRSGFV